MAEKFAPGYLATGVLFGMIIISLAIGYFFLSLDPILGFWLVYILTRPLGASFGDLMSQPVQYGGLGLGPVATSALFLTAIVTIVIFMSVRQEGEDRDRRGWPIGKGKPWREFHGRRRSALRRLAGGRTN
ncbi:hypothetical protein [Rhizobium phaseoli]|uniref:hypothetical protein n=1 Tax=Rhizobium phaseoli TaxID=396 RepID=UPI002554F63D|nr:hypothetical protein [Rhizobium phaseoli]MDK4727726.1 hypothetical protein [Rhizobium phaseoli]